MTPQLTTTSYAILGLLAIKPWTTYELTQQMDRSLGRFWPRAQSKLYEEPKKLVVHRLAKATEGTTGKRPRTEYSITAKGREALADWLAEPGAGPVIEFEQLVKVFFSDHGSRADTLATLDAAHEWARQRSAEAAVVGQTYVDGEGQFPERAAPLNLSVRFLLDLYTLVADWSDWARDVVETWPDDPSQASIDPAILLENQRRAETVAGRTRCR